MNSKILITTGLDKTVLDLKEAPKADPNDPKGVGLNPTLVTFVPVPPSCLSYDAL